MASYVIYIYIIIEYFVGVISTNSKQVVNTEKKNTVEILKVSINDSMCIYSHFRLVITQTQLHIF